MKLTHKFALAAAVVGATTIGYTLIKSSLEEKAERKYLDNLDKIDLEMKIRAVDSTVAEASFIFSPVYDRKRNKFLLDRRKLNLQLREETRISCEISRMHIASSVELAIMSLNNIFSLRKGQIEKSIEKFHYSLNLMEYDVTIECINS